MLQRNPDDLTDLVLQRGVRHAVHRAVEPWLALAEQCGPEDDSEVLHGHLVLRLVLDDSIEGRDARGRGE